MFIIAIDGPAGAGKGTVAQFLGKQLGFSVIETGLFYRALALQTIEKDLARDDESILVPLIDALQLTDLDNPHLRDEAVASVASIISKLPIVRKTITKRIRDVTHSLKTKGAVLDGRDVGTHIFKDANIKFYITADAVTRANRRLKEMQDKKLSPLLDNYHQAIIERDQSDTTRTHSPLQKAHDAIEVDTTNLSIQDACDAVWNRVQSDTSFSSL